MNPAVALVRSYLNLNGYFTVSELPVIRRRKDGMFEETTDLDILALRFPRARHLVSRGKPGPEDDLTFALDPGLDVPDDAMDMIIGEVKYGTPEINDALRRKETLYTALVRIGACPSGELDRVVNDLRSGGVAHLSEESAGIPSRIRLVGFGDGPSGPRQGFTAVSLVQVAEFLDEHLDQYRRVLHPVYIEDPALGVLHLLKKLEKGTDAGG